MGRVILPSKNITSSDAQTQELAKKLAASLTPPCCVAFIGELGAGKTTFIKGLVSFFEKQTRIVNSPTFVYLNIYHTKWPIYHFDLYRMNGIDSFVSMGFEEYFDKKGICLIEWPNKITSILPREYIEVRLKILRSYQRQIQIQKKSC